MSAASNRIPPRPGRDSALFLDIDGTLLDIAPVPSAVVVPPGLLDTLLGTRDALNGALALVSGRALSDIDRIFAPSPSGRAEFAAAGQHGAEIRFPGEPAAQCCIPPARLAEIGAKLDAFATGHPGVMIERKGFAVAAHYRQAPGDEPALKRFLTELLRDEPEDLTILEGRMVFEVKSAGIDKGAAVEHFMSRPPFAGRKPIFVGDDRTDEDGFAAALRLGGGAIAIGLGHETVAPWRLPDAAALRAWLGEFRGRRA